MDHYISPNFTHEKLENPTIDDFIDVFEDAVESWILAPGELLLNSPHGDVAAIGLLMPYFEMIETYATGQDSDRQSKAFFVAGFAKVFRSDSPIDKAAVAVYALSRCGFAHQGMFKYKVFFSRSGNKPVLVTFPKKRDGTLDVEAPAASVVINPVLFMEGIRKHARQYIKELRDPANTAKRSAFEASFRRQWGIGQDDPPIGMTEDEFLGR